MAQQKHEATFVGLDIGTSKVVCLVGLHQQDLATPSIIGLGVAPVSGLKRGVVTDVEETVSAITAALEEAERMSGVVITKASINVDGSHLHSLNASGVVAVSRADHQVSESDIERVELVTSSITLEANRQIISIIPKAYHVDDQRGVLEPVGVSGVKLEMEAHIITGSTPAVKNLQNSVFRSGIAIGQQVATPIAAAKALLSTQQKDLGVALVNFGSETTGIVIYENGVICHTSVVPIGSNNITKDLVYGLRTTPEVAEKLKIDHAIAAKPKGKTNKQISLEQYGSAGNVYQHDIDTIVASRLEEIFKIVGEEIKKSVKSTNGLGAGMVLTGGGANMAEITHFVRSTTGITTHLGRATGYTGISDKISDPAYSAVIGLMLEDMESPVTKHHFAGPAIFQSILNKIKTIFKSLMP